MKKKKRMLNETHILRFSVGAGLVIAILEIILSFTTRSQAILMDGVFDTAEGIVAGLFVLLVPLLYKPETEKMPYGYAQLESIFMIGKGCALASIILALCMLPQPIKMVVDSLRSVVLLAPKAEVVEYIKEVANNKVEGTGTEITFCDCVQTGRQIWVDIYVRNKENTLNVAYLKELRSHILENLQEEIEDIHLDITLDLD